MKIRIDNPCSENWNSMNLVEGGRFCTTCNCKVHDFTGSSAEEILEKYNENNGKICGRLPLSLLTKQSVDNEIKRGFFYQLKIFSWATVLCFGASLFVLPSADAKALLQNAKREMLRVKKDTAMVEICGVIKDKETKETLPFVNVVLLINDTTVIGGTSTNIDGAFKLTIDPQIYKKINIKVAYLGYSDKVIKNIQVSGNAYFNIELESNHMDLGGLIIIEKFPIEQTPSVTNPFQSGKTIQGEEYRRMPK